MVSFRYISVNTLQKGGGGGGSDDDDDDDDDDRSCYCLAEENDKWQAAADLVARRTDARSNARQRSQEQCNCQYSKDCYENDVERD